MQRRILSAGLVAGLVVVLAPASGARSTVKCKVGHAGWPASCVDRVGDVEGGPGPDITRVREFEWGYIGFEVTFAEASPLAQSATFTDTVAVAMSARGQTTRRYVLSFSTSDPRHAVLRRLPNGTPVVVPAGRMSRRTMVIGVDLDRIGNPGIVTFRVKAARHMLDGRPGGTDYTPDTGTMKWTSWVPAH